MNPSLFPDDKKNRFLILYSGLIYFIVGLPIFLSLVDGQIYTDAHEWKRYQMPALPVSQYFLLMMFVVLLKVLLKKKTIVYGVLFSLPSVMLVWIGGGSFRVLVIFVQAINFIIAIEIFRILIPKGLSKESFYLSILIGFMTIFILKVSFDFYVIEGKFPSRAFISKAIRIYNNADYFPLFYLFTAFFSLKYALFYLRKISLLSMSLLCLSLIVCVLTYWFTNLIDARVVEELFHVMLILIPFNLIQGQWKKEAIFHIYLAACLSFVLFWIFVNYQLVLEYIFPNDNSLAARTRKIIRFVTDFDPKWFLYPIGSDLGLNSITEMHHEPLQIYQWLGLPFLIWFYYLIIGQIRKILERDLYFALILTSVVFLGGNIQVNLLQSYSGILIAALIAGFQNVNPISSKNRQTSSPPIQPEPDPKSNFERV